MNEDTAPDEPLDATELTLATAADEPVRDVASSQRMRLPVLPLKNSVLFPPSDDPFGDRPKWVDRGGGSGLGDGR